MVTETQLSAVEALGVALSVQAPTTTMGECQEQAPGMLEHLRAMGFDVVPSGRLAEATELLRNLCSPEWHDCECDVHEAARYWLAGGRLSPALISDTDR